MKQWKRLCPVVVLGLLSLLPNATAQAQQAKSIGQVTALEGEVTVLHQKISSKPIGPRRCELP
jgi:hypothetical protein